MAVKTVQYREMCVIGSLCCKIELKNIVNQLYFNNNNKIKKNGKKKKVNMMNIIYATESHFEKTTVFIHSFYINYFCKVIFSDKKFSAENSLSATNLSSSNNGIWNMYFFLSY